MALLVCVPVCISGMLCVDAAGNDHDPAPFFHPVDKLVTVISLVSQNQLTVQGKRFQQRLGHTDIITVSAGEHAGLSRCHHHHLFRTVHEFLLYGNELPPGVGQGPAATVVSALRQGVLLILLLYLMEALFQLDGPPLASRSSAWGVLCGFFGGRGGPSFALPPLARCQTRDLLERLGKVAAGTKTQSNRDGVDALPFAYLFS